MLRKKKEKDQSVGVAFICVSLKENPICHENAVACRANGSAVDMPARDDIYLLLSRLRSLKIPENPPGSFHSDAGGSYLQYLSTTKAITRAHMPVAQDSNRMGAWGQWQVGTVMLPMYIPLFQHVWRLSCPDCRVFFFVWETHHSPFVMDQPCPYLVFSVWVASCKACRLQTLNQLQTPVVFNYWMEILSLQWLFGLWFGLLCIHCAFVYGLMAAGSVAWLQPMWANRTWASCWEPETAQ